MARDRAPPVQNGIRGSAFLRGCRYILKFGGLWRHASTSYTTVWSDIPKRRVSVLSVWTRMGQNSSIWCMTRCMCARARCKLGAMRASVPQPPFVHTYYSSTLILHMTLAEFQQNGSKGNLGQHYYQISVARTIFCFKIAVAPL